MNERENEKIDYLRFNNQNFSFSGYEEEKKIKNQKDIFTNNILKYSSKRVLPEEGLSETAIIVIAIVGSLVLLILIAIVVILVIRKKRQEVEALEANKKAEEEEKNKNNPTENHDKGPNKDGEIELKLENEGSKHGNLFLLF